VNFLDADRLAGEDGAEVDFFAKFSELSQQDTISKLLALLSEQGQFNRLIKVADSEPPRVRAMLGALESSLAPTLRHCRPCGLL
jgi:hypothetical protein